MDKDIAVFSDDELKYWFDFPHTDDLFFNQCVAMEIQRRGLLE